MTVLASVSTGGSTAVPTLPSPSTTLGVEDSKDVDLEAGTLVGRQRSILPIWLWHSRSCSSRANAGEPSDAHVESQAAEDPWATLTRTVDSSPEGYPQVATFQSSDPNFMLYRNFAYARGRVLSNLQYQLEDLEEELDQLDEWDVRQGNDKRLTSQRRDDKAAGLDKSKETFPFERTRPEVLDRLRTKLLDYDTMLLSTRDVHALQRPSNRDYKSVRNWFRGHEPLISQEMRFIRRKEDLVTLRSGREYAGFDGFVERCLSRLDSSLVKYLKWHLVRNMFLTPELRAKSSDEDVHYYAPARVEALVNVLITAIIFVMLVLPVVALYELSDIGLRASPFEAIGVLIIFTLLFGGAMSALTKARRQDLFAASAAYCGVLVVFISNFSTQTVVVVTS